MAVVVRGRLTGDNVDIVRRDLLELVDGFTGPELVLDLTEVSELDADGLRMLVRARDRMQARGQSLALKGLRHATALVPQPRTAADSLIGGRDASDNVVALHPDDA